VYAVTTFSGENNVIDEVDLRLKSWADGIVGAGTSGLTAPGAQQGARGVSLYLIDVISSPPPRAARKVRLEVILRYLVSTWSQDPGEAHRMLGDLLFAALENSDFSVESGPLPAALWKSLGVPQRPGFFMRVPVFKDLPERPVKYVRKLSLQTVPGTSLTGQVMGPGETPLSGAMVELPSLNLMARTDPWGRFGFPNVAAEPPDQVLVVRAKGREQTFRTEPNKGPDGIVRIQFQIEEA
jgi:hypothetical protein